MTDHGRIAKGGMGGFLNPPTHPEHDWHAEQAARDPRWSTALSGAAKDPNIDAATRNAAAELLASWRRPPLDSPEIQDWIAQVLGYFRGCFRNPQAGDRQWHASDLIIDKRDPVANADDHAGVNLIRRFYPEFKPTAEHFAGAYWGKKPEPKA